MKRTRAGFFTGKLTRGDRLVRAIFAVLTGLTVTMGSYLHADDRNREISSSILFNEVAVRSGIAFRFDNGSRGKHDLPEIMGGGVAIFDADGDGLLDVYLCNGGPIDATAGTPDPPCRLFRNRGGWKFENVTGQAAAPGPSYCDGSGRRRFRRRWPNRPVRHRLAGSAALSQHRQLPV